MNEVCWHHQVVACGLVVYLLQLEPGFPTRIEVHRDLFIYLFWGGASLDFARACLGLCEEHMLNVGEQVCNVLWAWAQTLL